MFRLVRPLTRLALLLALAPARAQPQQQSAAELILTGGKVYTSNPESPWAEALAIRGERIVAVGTTAEISRQAGASTRRIDLDGRVVIPGLNDAHNHLGWGLPIGRTIRIPSDFVAGPSSQELRDSLAAAVRQVPTSTWIRADVGLRILSDPNMRRAALDSIAPNHPVVLIAPWGHGAVVNTRVLRILGISDTAPDPLGGWYERVPGTRILTGKLEEHAQIPAWAAYYASAPDDMVRGLRDYAQTALALGVTSVQHMSSTLDAKASERIFRAANLPLRVRVIPFAGTTASGHGLEEWERIDPNPAPLTRVSGIKYGIDGTPFEQHALMRQPYPGRAGWHGRPSMSVDTLRQILGEALTGERQLMLHVIGDSASAIVLSQMEDLAPDSAWRKVRVRLEHAWGVTDRQVEQARRMGVVIAHTHIWGTPIRTWLQTGIPVGYGSDTNPNPFADMMLAITNPSAPSEAISREDAVRMFTWGSAYAEFAEKEKGTLAPGMLADLAVLSQDIFTIPPEAFPATRSVLTLVGGKPVYDAGVLKPTSAAEQRR